ncbi:NTP pyrophosphohydrolase [Aeriscardovia aeriphila]|uniref:NTP pyrophosphohydrolase n=2 Tax=Aeriscardovia aeriphila TaxID=218139 RepID=A0A261FDB5_9BIFI|nr:NTP pyrophosphohydrolase [Aeriscardovia aeriphila]
MLNLPVSQPSGAALERIEKRLQATKAAENETQASSGSVVNMLGTPQIARSVETYRGAIFSVDDRTVQLPTTADISIDIPRQIVHHSPAVILLVHDVSRDAYLVEREYRVGSNSFSFGFPAGLRDNQESALQSAFRELAEETGIVVEGIAHLASDPDFAAKKLQHAVEASENVDVDVLGTFYPSSGMSDEQVTLLTLHLKKFHVEGRHFDADEHVQSTWVSWKELSEVIPFQGSHTNFLILNEKLHRSRRIQTSHAQAMGTILSTSSIPESF